MNSGLPSVPLLSLQDIPKIDGKFYYLACPYGDPDPRVIEERMTHYEKVDARLAELGHFVMSPLDKHYKLKHGNLPGDYNYWQHYCKAMLKLASGLIVIMRRDTMQSGGVNDEIREAYRLGIPVYFVTL